MIKKYYWAIAVAAAFVAGTMTTGGVVYASFDQCNNDPPHGVSDGKPFLEIWQAICDLETQVDSIEGSDILGFYTIRDEMSLGDFCSKNILDNLFSFAIFRVRFSGKDELNFVAGDLNQSFQIGENQVGPFVSSGSACEADSQAV